MSTSIMANGKLYGVEHAAPGSDTNWSAAILDERQRKEVELAKLYERDFHHGTTGHNQLMLIALLARLLDESGIKLSPLSGGQ